MRSLAYRPTALADLDAIYDFIEPQNPRRALSYVDNIRAKCRTLRTHPQLGRAREDFGEGIRIYPIRRRIIAAYRITEGTIEITRVFSGGQDYEAILREPDGA